jgi:hypothetical protein
MIYSEFECMTEMTFLMEGKVLIGFEMNKRRKYALVIG